MPTPTKTLWPIEEHTKAKHEILHRYLGAWLHPRKQTPAHSYVDGFSGPGQYSGGEFGSPIIAINKAKSHGNLLSETEVVFLLINFRRDRIEHLEALIREMGLPSNFTVISKVGEFADQIGQIFAELNFAGNRLAPTFAFIDPFGWSGLPFQLVQRFVGNPRSEVFVNVMVDFIRRFLTHPNDVIREDIKNLLNAEDAEIDFVLRLPGQGEGITRALSEAT